MQRRKKQLLGLVGLALVAVVTAIACALPTPDASAYSTSSIPVTVRVETDGEVPTVQFISLKDKSTVVQKSFEVTIEYSKADRLAVTLTNNGNITKDQADRKIELATGGEGCVVSYSQTTQVCKLNFNLADTGLWTPLTRQAENGQDIDWPYGTSFTANVVAYNDNNSSQSNPDTVSFTYRAAYLQDFANETEANGDPVMHAVLGNVAKAEIFIFDESGKSIAGYNEDGTAKPAMDLANPANRDDYRFVLPLTQFGAKAGKYTVILTAYDKEDADAEGAQIIAISTVENVPYKVGGGTNPGKPTDPTNPTDPDDPNKPTDPDNPEVPDTGARLFGGLNISNADYIITGLIAFGMVTMFAVFLIIRRSKRQ